MVLKYKTYYATHKNDVGKISPLFRIRLKPNAQLLTQRPSKVPIHYRDKLNNLLKELEKHNTIEQIGSSPQDKPVYGTTYLNPFIIIPKEDTIKCVLDARHLNSNTEQSDESWPIEPLAPQLARANKKYKYTIDLMYAYARALLNKDTIKLTSFSSGDKLFGFIRGFYGLTGLPNFFTRQMTSFFKTLITFSLSLQPTSEHEYKFWHARRMALIQCSLTGTALSWYIRLNDTYNQDWHAFVQAFKKQFSSQKNAYYAQVKAFNLSKKDNETVRHFALKVQQLVEKGWCNENASTKNLKCNEIFTEGLPKNLKDFANIRQVKHTSTVLEPYIPFHTLVKLVDAGDIANDKIRTQNLALEINSITKQLNTQTLEPQSQEQLMFTQSKDPNNKTKTAYKKFCSYCHRINHSISACFKKQRDGEDKRDAYARSKSPQKSFVQYFRSPSNDRTKRYDTRYRSRSTSRNNSYNKDPSQNRYRSTSRDRFSYDKNTTPPQYSRSRYDTYKRDSRSYGSPYRSSYRSPFRNNSRPRYRSRPYSREHNISKYTNLLTDHLPDQEILDFLDHAHIPTLETNSTWYNHKTPLNQ